MKLSEKIKTVAAWLQNIDNELLVEASDEQLDAIADAFVVAAEILNYTAEEIAVSEPAVEIETPIAGITSEQLEEMAALATELDASGDPRLQKQASVLDEILLTLAAPKDYIFNFKKAEDAKIEELKKKYKQPHEEFLKEVGAEESLKKIKDSAVYQERHPLQEPLSSRSCPDHRGSMLIPIGNADFQCPLDHKIYNWETGFTKLDGTKVPGGNVNLQTPVISGDTNQGQIFDSREDRIVGNR